MKIPQSGQAAPLTEAELARAFGYPYAWPKSACVLIGDQLEGLEAYDAQSPLQSPLLNGGTVAKRLTQQGFEPGDFGPFAASLASGSNGAPERIAAKLSGKTRLPLAFFLPGALADHVSVYSCHFTSYGSIPATLTRRTGATSQLMAMVVPAADMEIIHLSEAIGRNYGFFQLQNGGFELPGGPMLTEVGTYLSLRGAFAPNAEAIKVAGIKNQGCSWEEVDQRGVLQLAQQAMGFDGSDVDFITGLIRDAACVGERNERLAGLAKMSIDTSGWHRLI